MQKHTQLIQRSHYAKDHTYARTIAAGHGLELELVMPCTSTGGGYPWQPPNQVRGWSELHPAMDEFIVSTALERLATSKDVTVFAFLLQAQAAHALRARLICSICHLIF